MLYQLPNGKVIEISLNDFLDLTDEDIQYLISINYGEYIHSPWFRSSVKNNKNITKKEDKSIDYSLDLEERDHFSGPEEDGEENLTIIESPDTDLE